MKTKNVSLEKEDGIQLPECFNVTDADIAAAMGNVENNGVDFDDFDDGALAENERINFLKLFCKLTGKKFDSLSEMDTETLKIFRDCLGVHLGGLYLSYTALLGLYMQGVEVLNKRNAAEI